MLERERLAPLEDPIQQLQLVAAEIIKLKTILGTRVEELGSLVYEDLSGRDEVRAVVHAYETALDRSQKVLIEMLRLNLDERLANLSNAQGVIMIQILEAVILAKKMGLSEEQVQTAKAIVAQEIPRVSALPAQVID
jgi:hypothetical protein